MRLNVHIHKIKSIDDLTIALPVDKGLYVITGQNGSGKRTIVACASRAFFRMKMADYFGAIEDDAFIECELNGITRRWEKSEVIRKIQLIIGRIVVMEKWKLTVFTKVALYSGIDFEIRLMKKCEIWRMPTQKC